MRHVLTLIVLLTSSPALAQPDHTKPTRAQREEIRGCMRGRTVDKRLRPVNFERREHGFTFEMRSEKLERREVWKCLPESTAVIDVFEGGERPTERILLGPQGVMVGHQHVWEPDDHWGGFFLCSWMAKTRKMPRKVDCVLKQHSMEVPPAAVREFPPSNQLVFSTNEEYEAFRARWSEQGVQLPPSTWGFPLTIKRMRFEVPNGVGLGGRSTWDTRTKVLAIRLGWGCIGSGSPWYTSPPAGLRTQDMLLFIPARPNIKETILKIDPPPPGGCRGERRGHPVDEKVPLPTVRGKRHPKSKG